MSCRYLQTVHTDMSCRYLQTVHTAMSAHVSTTKRLPLVTTCFMEVCGIWFYTAVLPTTRVFWDMMPSLGWFLPTFRRIVVPSSSRVEE